MLWPEELYAHYKKRLKDSRTNPPLTSLCEHIIFTFQHLRCEDSRRQMVSGWCNPRHVPCGAAGGGGVEKTWVCVCVCVPPARLGNRPLKSVRPNWQFGLTAALFSVPVPALFFVTQAVTAHHRLIPILHHESCCLCDMNMNMSDYTWKHWNHNQTCPCKPTSDERLGLWVGAWRWMTSLHCTFGPV